MKGGLGVYTLGGPPPPVIVTIGDNRDYIRVLLYSYYTTIIGWGVLLNEFYDDYIALQSGYCSDDKGGGTSSM